MDSNLDNILVNQKNHILALINNGAFQEAETLLVFVRPLWEHCSYEYKHKEVFQRLMNEKFPYY